MIDEVANRYISDIELIQQKIESISSSKKKIEEELSSEKNKLEELRNNLFNHMLENNLKIYINDSYEVVIKNNPRTFNVKDESLLFSYLKEIGEYDKCCKNEIKVDKRKLNQIFSDMKNCDSLPSCVEVVTGEQSIQIKSMCNVSNRDTEKEIKSHIKKANISSEDIKLEEFDSI